MARSRFQRLTTCAPCACGGRCSARSMTFSRSSTPSPSPPAPLSRRRSTSRSATAGRVSPAGPTSLGRRTSSACRVYQCRMDSGCRIFQRDSASRRGPSTRGSSLRLDGSIRAEPIGTVANPRSLSRSVTEGSSPHVCTSQTHPVARRRPALGGHARPARGGLGARLVPRADTPDEPPQRGDPGAVDAAQRVVCGGHAGLGAVRPVWIPARSAVRLDGPRPAARAGAAAPVDLALQHADRATHECQQHDRARQFRLRAGRGDSAVFRAAVGSGALSGDGGCARAAVQVLSSPHGVQAVQRLPDVPAMTAPATPRVKIFRWKAVGPLLVFFGIVGVLWILFADRIARHATQKVGTQVIGAKVEITDLHLDLPHGRVMIRGLTVASPHEAFRNLLQADELVADLDVVPLTEKKLIINRVAANGLRFGTPRQTDGRVAATSGDGIAGRVLAETRDWASQFQIPVLQLATGKISIDSLDPRRLSTIPAAAALSARADSSRRAWQAAYDSLRLGPTLDSASATLEQLRHARATDLATINTARQTIDRLKRARDRVTTLERNVKTGASQLQSGLAGLDSARQRDYAFARGLLKLPSLDAPAIGAAVFGPGAIKPFAQALYYTQLARRYMPPGLLPRAASGPSRVRRAGETVRFPKERALPAFLLRSAELSFLPQCYAGRLTGLTSDPALYGRPTVFGATG